MLYGPFYALSTTFGSSREARQAGSTQATAATIDHRRSHAGQRGHIGRLHAEQQRRDQAVQAEGPREPDHDADTREDSPSLITLASTLDRLAPSAIRIAISVAAPQRWRTRPVGAHGGQQQRQAGKEPEELRQEARPLDGFSKDRSISRRRMTGTVGSIPRTTRSTVCDNAAGEGTAQYTW